MRSLRTAIAVACCASFLVPSHTRAQRVSADGAGQTLEVLSNGYFDQVYFKYAPTLGTAAGLHVYDSQIEDYSAANVRAEAAALHTWERKIAALDGSGLDAEPAADRDILLNQIRSSLLQLEVIRGWEKNHFFFYFWVTN